MCAHPSGLLQAPIKTGKFLNDLDLGFPLAVKPQFRRRHVEDRVAEVLFFGDAPGYPGYNQVNFRVPAGVTPSAGAPVRLSYLGRSSNQVTIAVN